MTSSSEVFFFLFELNRRVRELLGEVNSKPFQKVNYFTAKGCKKRRFETNVEKDKKLVQRFIVVLGGDESRDYSLLGRA